MSETMRDKRGEVLYRLGQLFQAQFDASAPATFEIVVVERDGSALGNRTVCTRLYSGDFVYKGERFWIQEDKKRPFFYMTEELVCGCLRQQYGSAAIPLVVEAPVSNYATQREPKKTPRKKVVPVVKDDRQEGLFG